MRRIKWCLAALLAICLIVGSPACESTQNPGETVETEEGGIPENAVWLISKDESGAFVTNYNIIYGSESHRDRIFGMELCDRLNFLYKVKMKPFKDSEQPESQAEIIFGNSENRSLAAELAAAAEKECDPESYIWGYAYRDGQLALYSNNGVARTKCVEQFEAQYCVEEGIFVPDDLWVIVEMTEAEYQVLLAEEAARKAEEERRRIEAEWIEYAEKRLPEVKALNESIDSTQFGLPKNMGNSPFNAPPATPTKGQHPRIMVTEEMLPEMKAILEDERFQELSDKFWKKAKTKYGTLISGPVCYIDGVFQEETNSKGRFKYDGAILDVIEAKALAYLLTGEEIYGYEAIYGIKNAMLTLDYTTAVHMDTYHGASHVIVSLSFVYDWCYDLLTEKDKQELLGGLSNVLYPQLEFKFPPSNMNGLSGHGTGPQFYRDLTTISLAVYDELPDWWNYVGGRLFDEYVPIMDYLYQESFVPQGMSTYGHGKYANQTWCAWVVEHACGKDDLFTEDMKKAPYFLFSQILPNGRYFPSGDGTVSPLGMTSVSCKQLYFAAAVSRNEGIMNFVYNTTNHFSNTQNDAMSPSLAVILASQSAKPTSDDPFSALGLIYYAGHPGNMTTARNGWTEDAAVSWMRVSEMNLRNHDHLDTGTFQLYYKGLLALNSGSYKWYGNEHALYYHQATISHNGLLIFNPNLYDGTLKEDGTPLTPKKFFYSGGQRETGSASSFAKWLNGNWNTAVETGHAEGYKADGGAEYAYLAADLAPAYDAQTVDAVERRMLTVFTEDKNIPMLFFTFDSITSDGEDYKKTFLLHTILEPQVDAQNRTVTASNNDGGKLVLQNVIGEDISIEAIGGAGRAYEVNGVNILDKDSTTDNADKIWGRVEISTIGEKHSEMLNAMYVTDVTNKTVTKAVKVENDQVAGSVLAGTAAIFVRSAEREEEAIRFTTEGSGDLRYYVSGAAAGKWTVLVNGKNYGNTTASEDGGLLVFTAPAGNVEITAE